MEKEGIHIKALDTRPTPNLWVNFCFSCFVTLNRRRIEGYIPLTEIKTLAEIYNIDDVAEFLFYIETLDVARTNYFKEQSKENSKNGKHS